MQITKSQEEYIKTIYILQNMNNVVRVTDIANKLSVSKPSVSRSIKTLNELELVDFKTYGNVKLTDEGNKIAKDIIKRQDTLKNFLYEILDVDSELSEKEAAAMKHYLSDSTIKKIEEHVNKILDLGHEECNCDGNLEKCKKCIKYVVKNRIQNRRNKC